MWEGFAILDFRNCEHSGFVVWLTGLPSSGKTTLAMKLEEELRDRGVTVEVLDGDETRKRLPKSLGFSREDRDANIRMLSFIAKLLVRNGIAVIVAAISPYREAREQARLEIESFVEVHVDCPTEECIRRDVKGLYKKALAGEILNFTGISDPYEPPVSPELSVRTHEESVQQSLSAILVGLQDLGYLQESSLPHESGVHL